MSRPTDWNDLDDAYLEILGHHPDVTHEEAVLEGPSTG